MKLWILITETPPSKAAPVAGIAFMVSAVIVVLIDDFLLPNFVVPGDAAILAADIESSTGRFAYAVTGFLLVLLLDMVIGLALYLVLAPSGKFLAMLMAFLRLSYATILIAGLCGLAFKIIEVSEYASIKLVGYAFFAWHIFVLGYAVFRSRYMPRYLGVLLMIASVTYIVFFVDIQLSEVVGVFTMLSMAVAELSLSIWLVVKRKGLSGGDSRSRT